jgi:hypothetical protein
MQWFTDTRHVFGAQRYWWGRGGEERERGFANVVGGSLYRVSRVYVKYLHASI